MWYCTVSESVVRVDDSEVEARGVGAVGTRRTLKVAEPLPLSAEDAKTVADFISRDDTS